MREARSRPSSSLGVPASPRIDLERLVFEVHELVAEDQRRLEELRQRVEYGRLAAARRYR